MRNFSRLLPIAALLATLAGGAAAQSLCSSDGQPRPAALVERFINADCGPCWGGDARTVLPRAGELALDWIVPGSKGDDAPLAAVAAREALERLRVVGMPAPAQTGVAQQPLRDAARQLRVAHGLPFNGYIGTSIEMTPGSGGPWQAWLLLVQTIPAGTEATLVERNLVRNVLRLTWDSATPSSPQQRFFEARPMSIPEGADPARLSVVGWVEDARGQIKGIAQSRCVNAPSKG